ncbi:Multidrug resistance-associated protein 4 [Beauveria bassiana]|uniref:Canalicular multispecific organic anion transporter 1 n=1 Tax=Beauveria bassiana (strain ARSEF 2860) TaxID=655819 RepID=J4KMQ6_BEAB2|nr:canalicular multispecific organic anion transporter 1 [Beauveria bassiana ARSEF 2860]EJP64369.1 canalicular multispecific organic anion transporter 1 [Beauveria bassiana ARSEF 2860]KAF1735650.1 Multidrug resistance-associated protein 4 [Beauveria bassiana]KAH8711214.1 ABC transporter atnG [Beauveria bassiana]
MDVFARAVVGEGDGAFGPTLDGLFDFSLSFEHSILSILPTSVFIVLTPVHVNHLWRRQPCVKPGVLLWLKMLSTLLLLSCQVASLALWAVSSVPRHDLAVASAAIACLGSICIFFLLYAEHIYSYRPSTLLSLYLTLMILFDIAKTRSYFLRADIDALAGLSVAVVVLELALLLFQEVPKRRLITNRSSQPRLSGEALSGFWGRALFLWVNSTLKLGFRSILRVEDLRDLGPEFSSERLYADFEPHWQAASTTSNHSLTHALLRTLYPEFLRVVVPRLCFLGFTFAQPWLIMSIIHAVVDGNPGSEVSGGLVGATALIYIGIAISRGYYKHHAYRSATLTRGILVTAILHKALKLTHTQLKKSAALTLMTADIETLTFTITTFHDLWASAFELALAIFMLAKIIGGACFFVLIPAVLSAMVSSYYTKRLGVARKTWNEKIEKRVGETKDVITQLKAIKMSGLAPFYANHIEDLREDEIKTSLPERSVRVGLLSVGALSDAITPVVVVAGALFWTRETEKLTTAQFFTVLSVVAVVVGPMTHLLTYLPFAIGGYAGLTRIQAFLRLEERFDSRQSGNGPVEGAPIDMMMIQAETLRKARESAEKGPSPFAIELVHVTINRLENAAIPLLDNISLQFRTGQISMIVGPVGAGKSTLCRAILGEQKLDRGFVLMGGIQVAYCDQSPWLQNMCIRDSVIAHCEYVLPWYRSVIWACALEEDLEQLPDGDKTMVGSGGGLISGGQKQRVALARAVYSRASVIVLDDVLSALDSETAEIILTRLLGDDGLLIQTGTTVIMTTNIREHLPLAHTVYALDGKGNVKETVNNSPELIRKEYLVSSSEKEASKEVEPFVPKAAADPSKDQAHQRQRGDFSLYMYYFRSSGIPMIILWILSISFAAVIRALPQIYASLWMDQDPYNMKWFYGYAALAIGTGITLAVSLFFYYFKVVPKSSRVLHNQLLKTTMKAQLPFITKTESGALVSKFSQDIGFLSQQLPQYFLEFTYTAVACLVSIGVIMSGASYAAIAVPALLIFLWQMQRFYLRTSRQIRHMDLEAKSPLYTLFQDVGDGIMHIRAFQWESDIKWQGYGLLDYSQRPYYHMYAIQRWLALVMDLTVAGIAMLLVGLAVNLPGKTSGGAIGLSLVTLVNLSESMSFLVQDWSNLETSLGAMARVREFNNTTPLEPEPVNNTGEKLPENWPSLGRIDITGVTAKYDPLDMSARPVLKDMSLIVHPREKVAIIGRTGSGKSSLLLAILSFLDYSGTIQIDGRDVRNISPDLLRSRIVTVSQDDVELAASIRVNLNPFELRNADDHISDDVMIDYLTRVKLWPLIQAHGGLDTQLRDLEFSKGQKQLLCIARAMLRRQQTSAHLILVDEATSNVDEETDEEIQREIAAAFANCTVLTVTHRMSAVHHADVIVEMENGNLNRVITRRAPRDDEAF